MGNRANKKGIVLDPRQGLFLKYYLDPESDTFSNGKQSAIRAGYTEEYAKQIIAGMPEWLSDNIRHLSMAQKAEKNLSEFLDTDVTQQAMGAFGPIYKMTSVCCAADVFKKSDKKKSPYICSVCNKKCTVKKEPVLVRNSKIMGLKLDASKFVAERLNRKRYGKDEAPTGSTNIIILGNDERTRKIAKRVIARATGDGDQPSKAVSN